MGRKNGGKRKPPPKSCKRRLTFLPYRDGELTVGDDIACELAKWLRRLRPQVIITHWRDSIHSDHTATYFLVRCALFLAANPHFDLDGLPPARGMRLY
jgi:LmbE family N-acetylglucosaminyl deacetylase